MKSKWITHLGKRIFYSDYTDYGLGDFEALKAEVAGVEAVMLAEPEHSILAITDIRGSIAHSDAVNLFKESASKTQKQVIKQAVVGVSGIKKILFDAVVRFSGQPAEAFDDIEKAKDWLVRE